MEGIWSPAMFVAIIGHHPIIIRVIFRVIFLFIFRAIARDIIRATRS